MAASQYFTTVQQVYIAYYQRPADPAGLLYWAQQIDAAGGNLNAVINAFATSAESQALYGTINSSTTGTATPFLAAHRNPAAAPSCQLN